MRPFRLDRLLTLGFIRPASRLRAGVSPGVPILMYHSVSESDEARTRPYFRTVTDPRIFRRHVEIVARQGYRAATLADAAERLRAGSAGLEKLVVFTFDDGYADFWSEAYPVLSRYGFTATVFLPTAYIAHQPRSFSDTPCLTWSQVRSLHREGVEFGSHTVTHRQLADLEDIDVEKELRSSKTEIEDRIGSPVTSFAYPFAFPDQRPKFKQKLHSLLEDSGYLAGVCTTLGTANRRSNPFFLERLPINTLDDDAFFKAKLAGSYDWLRHAQRLYKLCKGWKA